MVSRWIYGTKIRHFYKRRGITIKEVVMGGRSLTWFQIRIKTTVFSLISAHPLINTCFLIDKCDITMKIINFHFLICKASGALIRKNTVLVLHN